MALSFGIIVFRIHIKGGCIVSQKIKNLLISIASSRKTLLIIMGVIILSIAIPVLATYTGPNRTTTERVCEDIQVVDYCTYSATVSSYDVEIIGSETITTKLTTKPCTVTSNGCEPNVSIETWRRNCFGNAPDAVSVDSNVTRREVTHPEKDCHNETVAAPPATVNGSVSCTNGTNGWCRSDATLNITGSDPNPANTIIAIEGTRNGTDFACASDTCQIDATGNGSFAFEYWAVSSHGDTSYKGNTTITVDKETPVVGLNLSGSMGYNNWYVSGVNWTTSLTDSVSGPSHVNVSVDGTAQSNPGSYAADGSHTIKATGYDNAGNSSQTQQTVQIDQTNPVPAYTLNGSLGTNGWYTSAVNWNASATDATSGVYAVGTQLDGASVNNSASIGTNGSHTLQVTAQDNAGNLNSTSGSFKIDQEDPFVSLNLSGTQGTHSWYTAPVSWSSTASDTVSGLASHTATLNGSATTINGSVNSDGTYTLLATAQDNASNQSAQTRTFGIDQSAPTVSLNPISGTHSNIVQLSGSSADTTSGVSYVEISIAGQTHQVNTTGVWSYQWNSTSACNGNVTASVRSVDQAGNVSASTTQTFTVQNTPTTLTLPAQTNASNPVVFNLNTNNLNQMVIRISDDAGHLPAVTHTFTGTSIPSSYRWDRYMGDGSLAPKGTYTMNVRIYDKNTCTTDTASITLVVTESILSAWISGAPTNTPIPAQPTATPLPSLTPTVESAETEVAILPATGNDTETPTSTPTTTPNPNPFVLPKAEQKTTTSTSSSPKAPNSITDPILAPTTLSTGVLIGSAAAGLIGSIAAYQVAVEAERKRKEAEARKRAEELMHLRNKLTKNGEDWHGLGMDQMKQKAAQIDAINKANEDYMYESVIASGGDPNMSIEEAVAIFTNASARKEKEAVYKKAINDRYGGVLSDETIDSYAEDLSYGKTTLEEVMQKANRVIDEMQLGLASVSYLDEKLKDGRSRPLYKLREDEDNNSYTEEELMYIRKGIISEEEINQAPTIIINKSQENIIDFLAYKGYLTEFEVKEIYEKYNIFYENDFDILMDLSDINKQYKYYEVKEIVNIYSNEGKLEVILSENYKVFFADENNNENLGNWTNYGKKVAAEGIFLTEKYFINASEYYNPETNEFESLNFSEAMKNKEITLKWFEGSYENDSSFYANVAGEYSPSVNPDSIFFYSDHIEKYTKYLVIHELAHFFDFSLNSSWGGIASYDLGQFINNNYSTKVIQSILEDKCAGLPNGFCNASSDDPWELFADSFVLKVIDNDQPIYFSDEAFQGPTDFRLWFVETGIGHWLNGENIPDELFDLFFTRLDV